MADERRSALGEGNGIGSGLLSGAEVVYGLGIPIWDDYNMEVEIRVVSLSSHNEWNTMRHIVLAVRL